MGGCVLLCAHAISRAVAAEKQQASYKWSQDEICGILICTNEAAETPAAGSVGFNVD